MNGLPSKNWKTSPFASLTHNGQVYTPRLVAYTLRCATFRQMEKFTSIRQVLRRYWPKRTRLEDERDEINSKPMEERTLSDWLRLVAIEREIDPWGH